MERAMPHLMLRAAAVMSAACLTGLGTLAAQGRPATADTSVATGVMPGRLVDDLPVDSVTGALLLIPGVGTAADGRLSVRGAPGGETATYLDGIPVTPGTRVVRLAPATNSIDEATVLTGPLSATLGNTTAGAILMRTRTMRGARVSWETDGPLGASSLGLNRFEAAAGATRGHLNLFAGGALQGQASAEPGFGARLAPIFVRAGLDTTVTVDGAPVDLFNYAVARGDCDTFAESADAGIAGNFGLSCAGDRTPLSAVSNHQILLKAEYGTRGSSVGVIGLRSRDQGRRFDYATLYLPSNAFGQSTTSDLLGVTFAHRMGRNGVFRASLSRQRDDFLSGPLSPAGEAASRDPSLGLMVGRLGFQYDFESFPIDSALIRNYRQNTPGSRRSPYDLENTAQYGTISRYLTNAYAVAGFAESGGPLGLLQLDREDRTVATAAGDWQVSPNSRFQLGGELTRYTVHHYEHQLTSQAGSDVYIVAPRALSLFAEDVFQYGHVMFSAGVRYERFSSNADRPFVLDTVASSPSFNTYQPFPRISSYAGSFNGDSLATTVRDKTHSAFLPRFRMTYGLSPATELRAGYAREAGIPDFRMLYAGINTDLAITSTSQVYGSDLDLAKRWVAEVGARHRLGGLGSVDLALFRRSGSMALGSRNTSFPDPTRHNASISLRQFAYADSSRIWGGEIRLERRAGALTGTVGYAYQHASDFTSALSGADRPHTLSAAVALRLHGTAALAAFRYASGLPYTSCAPLGNEAVLSGEPCAGLGGSLDDLRLPAFRQLDLRVSQGLRVAGRTLTAFADARNVLNFRNVRQVYAATGTTASPAEAQLSFSGDSITYASEAKANGAYLPNGAVDLSFAGAGNAGCAPWVTQSGAPGAPDCISLVRAEERFGNGDRLFDVSEQQRASAAAYAAVRGAQLLTNAPRRVRVGVQIGL
jgi:hypothetical protein